MIFNRALPSRSFWLTEINGCGEPDSVYDISSLPELSGDNSSRETAPKVAVEFDSATESVAGVATHQCVERQQATGTGRSRSDRLPKE
jgi:hypothetical protein